MGTGCAVRHSRNSMIRAKAPKPLPLFVFLARTAVALALATKVASASATAVRARNTNRGNGLGALERIMEFLEWRTAQPVPITSEGTYVHRQGYATVRQQLNRGPPFQEFHDPF